MEAPLQLDSGRIVPMSLGIAFKGPEGIVLAADSRVTLTAEMKRGEQTMLLPSTYDNATKLLRINRHEFVGVVTYGLGAIGQSTPRTVHSYLPELEGKLAAQDRLTVEEYASECGAFFEDQWKTSMPKDYQGPDIVFLVGGFDPEEPYGRVFRLSVPSSPEPEEQNADQFGITWGGQLEYTTRLLKGFDPELPSVVQQCLGLDDEERDKLTTHLDGALSSHIPYEFLPLQDCVDLSIFLIRTTMRLQNWSVGVRGVGGAIDVATVTRVDGFQPIQQKRIVGSRTIADI
jgi:hypothetical protein